MRSIPRPVPLAAAGLALAAAALAGCGGSGGKGLASAGADRSSGGGRASASAAPTTHAPADNGVSSLPAADIADKAITAAKASTSVHVSGSVRDQGVTIKLNIRTARSGVGYGSINYGGAPLELIATPSTVWIRSTSAGWAKFVTMSGDAKEATQAGALLGNRWVKAKRAGNSDLTALTDLVDEQKLLGQILPEEASDLDSAVKGGAATEGGVPVTVIADSTSNARFEVATVGQPYPMLLAGSDSSTTIAIHLDSWGAAVRTTPPSGTDVLDTTQLPGFSPGG